MRRRQRISPLFPYTTLFRSPQSPDGRIWMLPWSSGNSGRGSPVAQCAKAEPGATPGGLARSEEHTSELQSLTNLVCRLLLEKKKKDKRPHEMNVVRV